MMERVALSAGRCGSECVEYSVIKNLVNTPDPRLHGKALKGNLKGIWRYRVGDYRLFASIEEDIITIRIFEIGHRRDIYKK